MNNLSRKQGLIFNCSCFVKSEKVKIGPDYTTYVNRFMEVHRPEKFTEEDLVRMLRDGSNTGFAYLYENYSSVLYGKILSIVQDEEYANDILQETFVNIYRKFDTYDSSRSRLFTWMVTIARNLSKDFINSKSYRNKLLDVDMELATDMPLQSLLLDTDQLGVSNYIFKLDKKYSKLLEMNYLQGYTNEEISKILDLPLGTVKTRIRSALVQMRKLIKE